MSSIWLKIAAVIVVILVIVVLVNNVLTPKETQPKPPDKGFYDVAEKDKERLSGAPKPEDFEQNVPQQQSNQPAETAGEVQKPAGPVKLYFKEISEEEAIEAERLLGVAVPGRSIGRLPMTGFSLMVPNCRDIMERWPGTIYDYKARRLMCEIPQRFHSRYKITPEDLDLTRFTVPKEGTKVFIMEEDQ